MKSTLLLASLLGFHVASTLAQQSELRVAIAQTGSPRRFVAGDERSQIFVLVSNLSGKPQRVWQAWNAWGARTITLEVADLHEGKLGFIFNGQQAWTRNAPAYDTIAPGDGQVFPVSLHRPGPWELRGAALKNLPKEVWHKVRIRAVFESKDFEQKGVWTGEQASPYYDFELRIKGDQIIGDAPPIANPAPLQDIADLEKIPDGNYSVNLEWWEKKQALTVSIRNHEARVIQSSDPLLADMRATFQRHADGMFFIILQTKDGQSASQHWIPQHDGSFVIKEVPDRGERQRAVPLPKNL